MNITPEYIWLLILTAAVGYLWARGAQMTSWVQEFWDLKGYSSRTRQAKPIHLKLTSYEIKVLLSWIGELLKRNK